MAFITDYFLTVAPWSRHKLHFRRWLRYGGSYYAQWKSYEAMGVEFADFFGEAIFSVPYLTEHGTWKGTEEHPANAWLDFDSIDEFWVGGSQYGPDLLGAVWASFFLITMEPDYNDDGWIAGLTYVALTGSQVARYNAGLFCRINILMAQLKAAKCLLDIFALHQSGGVA